MKTLVPQNFLRVADKFYPRFIDLDREVGLGASHLYAFLFVSSLHTGECSVPMETLALVCKGCERTARTYLGILRHYEYIDVRRDWTSSNGRSVYRLLRSPRLMSLLKRLGYETDSLFLSEDRKNVPVGAAKSAGPSFKEDKKEEKRDIPPFPPFRRPARATFLLRVAYPLPHRQERVRRAASVLRNSPGGGIFFHAPKGLKRRKAGRWLNGRGFTP